MSQFRLISASEIDFSKAPIYRKIAKVAKSNIEVSKITQEVVTCINGDEETRNTANPGDYIVTGMKGERYVIKSGKFAGLYEEDPENPDQYRSKSVVRGIELQESAAIEAPWGEIQCAEAGGYICQALANANDVYLIEKDVFAATYAPDAAEVS